ncbi:glycogen debranching protein GlgX [Caldimonas aquatica]|uniref:Glycogen debranching protein GlgX n=1 Tax=Caldimonas aquatica TaxID=376175 RepID=A0ABY6MTN8_9BURK|nr:glycogen debranching protein GlgX [Schlegelella aquatica]UZD55370.1 glycogen debranching protein GlgX [Schlegelella aquatica]
MPKGRRIGRPYPLGATWDGKGVNFAVHSRLATRVEVCLFDRPDAAEGERIELTHRRYRVWYGYVPGLAPGALYGFRVYGPWAPERGCWCNPRKLLLDPYARALVGSWQWSSAHYGFVPDAEEGAPACSIEDDAPVTPKCQVVDDRFDWGRDRPPRIPWRDTILYELHVKGYTRLHPDVPSEWRGTYLGLTAPPVIEHLKSLGVTAVELMPVHAFVDDHRLVQLGLRNYWGYNPVGYFAPEPRYAMADAVREFKQMVKALHEAGLEVILDVVYNHTAEGDHRGPTISFRGLDNPTYYRLLPDDASRYENVTGCGNTIDAHQPAVVRLIMDSLRYWVTQMHVDGFRFDLASALGRVRGRFDPHCALFSAIAQDPVLSQVKLIAEPWDLGEGGYQVGGFPAGWAEWNGQYRDTVRGFWCGQQGHLAALSERLCGSSDLYRACGRLPTDSINFITVHDGFTLHDLVSYNVKHNEANGEDNRDGDNHNRSWNCGAEGPTDDEVVNALRERQKRNLLATLFLSQGTPLLLAGDEIGRTQRGNNNAYCQDNEVSWVHWGPLTPPQQLLCDYVRRLIAFRKAQPALRRTCFFEGEADEAGHKDITWLTAQGEEMRPEHWQQPHLGALAAMICGWKVGPVHEPGPEEDPAGPPASPPDDRSVGDSVLILINEQHDPVAFALPPLRGGLWTPRIDTRTPSGVPAGEGTPTQGRYVVAGRSIAVLTQPSS